MTVTVLERYVDGHMALAVYRVGKARRQWASKKFRTINERSAPTWHAGVDIFNSESSNCKKSTGVKIFLSPAR